MLVTNGFKTDTLGKSLHVTIGFLFTPCVGTYFHVAIHIQSWKMCVNSLVSCDGKKLNSLPRFLGAVSSLSSIL